MIKANDLRIGNWVKTTHNDFWEEHFRGVAVKMELYLLDNLITTGLELFEPIELTPELLGKIKEFNIKLGDGIGMEIGGLVLACYNHTPNKVLLMMHDSDGDLVNAVDTEIMYLHTLQNLVYELSGGTELSITL